MFFCFKDIINCLDLSDLLFGLMYGQGLQCFLSHNKALWQLMSKVVRQFSALGSWAFVSLWISLSRCLMNECHYASAPSWRHSESSAGVQMAAHMQWSWVEIRSFKGAVWTILPFVTIVVSELHTRMLCLRRVIAPRPKSRGVSWWSGGDID